MLVKEEIVEIPLEQIFVDNKWNVRGSFSILDVAELAKDITKHGLQIPITVVPHSDPANPNFKFRLIAGFRRYSAFRVNRSPTIPAMVKVGLSRLEERSWNIRENVQRSNLNIAQEAHALQEYINEGYDAKYISEDLGQSKTWVDIRLLFLKLHPAVQEVAAAGFINQDQIRKLSKMTFDQQCAAARAIKETKLRGEKKKILPDRKVDPKKRKIRTQAEINRLIDLFFEKLGVEGMGLHTRCLSWAAGNISTQELFIEIEAYAQQHEILFTTTAEEWANDDG